MKAATLYLRVCELHLLYERRCQSGQIAIKPGPMSWQHISVPLEGPDLTVGTWLAPRMAVFELSVLGAGSAADITGLRLQADDGPNLLRNGDFSKQMDHWLPLAQATFVPWHIDNLYLELLVERGPMALIGLLVVVAWTLRRLLVAPVSGRATLAPFLIASLSGALLIGLVSSVLDASRPAFLLSFCSHFHMRYVALLSQHQPMAL
jgi:hypothetical protein